MKNKMLKKICFISSYFYCFYCCLQDVIQLHLNETEVESAERPIIIQGPMPIEAEKFAKKLENVKDRKIRELLSFTKESWTIIL